MTPEQNGEEANGLDFGYWWRQMSALRNWKKAGAGADTDH